MKRDTFGAVVLLVAGACGGGSIPCSPAVAMPPPPSPAPSARAPTRAPSVAAPPSEPEPAAVAPVLEEPLEPDDPAEVVHACRLGTAEARKAQLAIDAIDAKVGALAADGDPMPIEAEIRQALRLPCLRLGIRDTPALAADSGYALKQWWKEGGKWWLGHYLELTIPRTVNSLPSSVVAPTMRRTLTLETRRNHPLRDLLCGAQDSACATETRDWATRAAEFFKRFVPAKHWLADEPPSIDECSARALKAPARSRYGTWRRCLAEARPQVSRLPIGSLKAPTKGWLLLRGRRGHYVFCDEVRAYDLGTGAVYIAKSCSGLALVSDGSVDGAKTDDARKEETLVGSVPRDALREAAWMILLASEVQEDVVEARGFALPVGVEPQRGAEFAHRRPHYLSIRSSDQTILGWSYMPDGPSVVSSYLTWPEDRNHAAREHAVSLLRAAEAGFVAGCPAAPPPSVLDWGFAKPAVSPLDASASSLRKVDQELVVALGKARAQACSGK